MLNAKKEEVERLTFEYNAISKQDGMGVTKRMIEIYILINDLEEEIERLELEEMVKEVKKTTIRRI